MYAYHSTSHYQTKSELDSPTMKSPVSLSSSEIPCSVPSIIGPPPILSNLALTEHWPAQYSVVSSNGWIRILGYNPTEGPQGVQMTVQLQLRSTLDIQMHLRLVMGTRAISTTINDLNGPASGQWELHATVPPLDDMQVLDGRVAVSIQALDSTDTILDSVTFGEFSYVLLEHHVLPTHGRSFPLIEGLSNSKSIMHFADSSSPGTRSTHRFSTPSPTPTHARHVAPRLVRRSKSGEMIAKLPPGTHCPTPNLQLRTSLASLCKDWGVTEVNTGRRLVRFHKRHEDCNLVVSCEAVDLEEYSDRDTVISCILSKTDSRYYVTSVDVIYLLEKLTGQVFPVEEKNRVRRNLEGLRPETVSRNSDNLPDLFTHIMDLPDPKPRNIEKDLKVFQWQQLGQALDKILSKYACLPVYEKPHSDVASIPNVPVAGDCHIAAQPSYPSHEEPCLSICSGPYSTNFELSETAILPTLPINAEVSPLLSSCQPVLVPNAPEPSTMHNLTGWPLPLKQGPIRGIDNITLSMASTSNGYSDMDFGLDITTYLSTAYIDCLDMSADSAINGENTFAELSDIIFNQDQFIMHD